MKVRSRDNSLGTLPSCWIISIYLLHRCVVVKPYLKNCTVLNDMSRGHKSSFTDVKTRTDSGLTSRIFSLDECHRAPISSKGVNGPSSHLLEIRRSRHSALPIAADVKMYTPPRERLRENSTSGVS